MSHRGRGGVGPVRLSDQASGEIHRDNVRYHRWLSCRRLVGALCENTVDEGLVVLCPRAAESQTTGQYKLSLV